MTTFQRRLVLGAIAGLLVAATFSAVPNKLWLKVESPLVYVRAWFNIVKPFKSLDKEIFVLEFDKAARKIISEDVADSIDFDSEFTKQFLIGLMQSVDAYRARSINIAINSLGDNLISDLNLEAKLSDVSAPVKIISSETHIPETTKKSEQLFFLNPSKAAFKKHSLADFLTGKYDVNDLQGKAVIISSSFDKSSFKSQLNKTANFLADEWLRYERFNGILSFLLLACLGVVFVSLIFELRLMVLAGFAAVVTVLNQILYSFAAINVETVPLISAAAFLCLATIIYDMNVGEADIWSNLLNSAEHYSKVIKEKVTTIIDDLALRDPFNQAQEFNHKIAENEINKEAQVTNDENFAREVEENIQYAAPGQAPSPQRSFKAADPNFEPIRERAAVNPHAQAAAHAAAQQQRFSHQTRIPQQNANPVDVKEIREQIYKELESQLESLAKDFQGRTVRSMINIQERIDEMIHSDELSEMGKSNLELIKYEFDKTINEFDTLLFGLVPFKFEGSRGLIDSLELFARKSTEMYRGRPRIYISAHTGSLHLESNHKINIFRTIQRLTEMIVTNNYGNSNFSNVNIDVIERGSKVGFRISYDGNPIENQNPNPKLAEIQKRAATINLRLEMGFNWEDESHTKLVNKIELILERDLSPKSKLAYQ